MTSDFRTFLQLIIDGDYEIIGVAYPISAVIGFLGYSAFYFSDKALGLYENLYLRIFIALLFFQLFFLKKNFSRFKIFAVETILALCLPFFYAYFYCANNGHIFWAAGFIFCGFTYGFLTGKSIHTVSVFPLFVLIGFFVWIYSSHATTIISLYHAIPILSLSMCTALFASAFKFFLDYLILIKITVKDQQTRLVKEGAVKNSVDYNLNLEKDLNKVKTLNTVSKLLGGLVGDFDETTKNIALKSIVLKDLYQSAPQKKQRIETVIAVVNKSSTMITNIAAFTPNNLDKFRNIDINLIVNSLNELLLRTVSTTITIKLALLAKNSGIWGNAAMIEQAFINISINAFQAMPQGGTLFISTENVPKNIAIASDKEPHDKIIIRFRDTGGGIDKKTRENIFKPFFSTKGTGSGLGLVMVNETISRHSGSISLESAPFKGTTFSITFPVKYS